MINQNSGETIEDTQIFDIVILYEIGNRIVLIVRLAPPTKNAFNAIF